MLKVKDQGQGQVSASTDNLEEVTSKRQTGKFKAENFSKSLPHTSTFQPWYKPQNIQNRTQTPPLCNKCNRKHYRNARCPAMGKRCRGCNKYNNFQTCCSSSHHQRGVREVVSTTYDDRLMNFFLDQSIALIKRIHGK